MLSPLGDNYPNVAYIDHFGNLMTGVWAEGVENTATFEVCGHEVSYARTFGKVAFGALFWYKNSNGLIEIAPLLLKS